MPNYKFEYNLNLITMKNTMVTLCAFLFSQIIFGQKASIQIEDCNSLIVLNPSKSKFENTYILEKEISEGVWKKVQSKISDSKYLNFAIDQSGNYKTTIFSYVDGKIQTEYIKVNCDIWNKSEPNFSIYPNPTESNLTISLNQMNDAQYEYSIYSVTGVLLKKEKLFEATSTIFVNDLGSGIYIINLLEDQAKIRSSKLIIN